jgi:sigma-B regulation protein RsbU (phosphoserine phosphatase)
MERTFGQSFITAFLGMINLRDRTFTYSNAGQNPPLLRDAHGEVTELRGTGDIPLSVRGNWSFSEQRIEIPPQSTLWLYTDGVVETLSPKGEAFGDARLRHAIRHVEGGSSRAVADLVGMLRAHEGGRRPSDDQVIMLVEFK